MEEEETFGRPFRRGLETTAFNIFNSHETLKNKGVFQFVTNTTLAWNTINIKKTLENRLFKMLTAVVFRPRRKVRP